MTKLSPASVRARLMNRAKATERPFQEVLQHYGLERFLFRLAQSSHGARFVLKGALMLRAWGAPGSRPTRDIDVLGYVENELAVVEDIMREVCRSVVIDDALFFDPESVSARRIKEDADYEGVRITLAGSLERARIPVQIDVAFGDVVHPRAEERDYPSLLDLPAPRLRMYPRETVVAEKLEAMVYLGTLNSRMKDFYDLWLLAQRFDFDGAELALAVGKTFAHRRTPPEPEPVALTETFTRSVVAQQRWSAFVKRSQLEEAPSKLDEIRAPLREFLLLVLEALVEARTFRLRWNAQGPWG